MSSRPILASLLCASLASLAPATARAQLQPAGLQAITPLVTANAVQADEVVTSVLGLRADDAKAGEDLTTALRKAFAEREMQGGQDLTLEEVVLTLDCSSEQDTACMAEAGRALETERMVYGTLAASGGSYVLEIIVLDVASGQVEAQATVPIEKEGLGGDNIDATAKEVVNSLYPRAEDIPDAPVAADVQPEENSTQDDEPKRESDYVWGPYKPRPKWKKVGLGVSATLAVLGAAGSVTGWVLYKQRYEPEVTRLREEIGDGGNLEKTPDYCSRTLKEDRAANENGSLSKQQEQRAESCRAFVATRAVNVAGAALAAVAGASTVVFTVLYFVHKKKAPGAEARNKRSFRLTANPTRGGAMLGGYGRF
jgi:hypothetical protein